MAALPIMALALIALIARAQLIIGRVAPECTAADRAPVLWCHRRSKPEFKACGLLRETVDCNTFCYDLLRTREAAQRTCVSQPKAADIIYLYNGCIAQCTRARAEMIRLNARGLVYLYSSRSKRFHSKLVFGAPHSKVKNYVNCRNCHRAGVWCPWKCRRRHSHPF